MTRLCVGGTAGVLDQLAWSIGRNYVMSFFSLNGEIYISVWISACLFLSFHLSDTQSCFSRLFVPARVTACRSAQSHNNQPANPNLYKSPPSNPVILTCCSIPYFPLVSRETRGKSKCSAMQTSHTHTVSVSFPALCWFCFQLFALSRC